MDGCGDPAGGGCIDILAYAKGSPIDMDRPDGRGAFLFVLQCLPGLAHLGVALGGRVCAERLLSRDPGRPVLVARLRVADARDAFGYSAAITFALVSRGFRAEDQSTFG